MGCKGLSLPRADTFPRRSYPPLRAPNQRCRRGTTGSERQQLRHAAGNGHSSFGDRRPSLRGRNWLISAIPAVMKGAGALSLLTKVLAVAGRVNSLFTMFDRLSL